MRRTDKEIRDRRQIESILEHAEVCRLAFSDDGQAYIVPLNFGYRDGALYFHSAPCGRKIDIIQRNSRVCFEIDLDVEIVPGEKPCAWSTRYRSVIGFGTASIIEDPSEKRDALAIIGEHYSHRPFDMSDSEIEDVAVIKVGIEDMTGKSSGY